MDTIKGTVTEVLAPDSSGKTQSFILQTEGQYPKLVAVKCWLDKIKPPIVNSIVTAHVNISSREYNGKWYTDVSAWRIEAATAPQPSSITQQGEDLPF